LIQNGADVYAQDEKGFTSFAWLFYGIDEKLTPDLLNSYIDLFESAAGKTFLIEEEKKDSLKHIQAALDRIIYKALSDVIARRIKEAKEAIKKSETEKVDKQQAEIERLSNELEKLKTQERAIEATDSKTVQILLNINGQEKYYLLNSDKKTLVVNVFVENKTESS
jgi:gas vesicle protein